MIYLFVLDAGFIVTPNIPPHEKSSSGRMEVVSEADEMQADNSFGVIANDDTGRPRATSSGEDDHDGFSLPLPE